MNKLIVSYNKTLKLTNACVRVMNNSDLSKIDRIVQAMSNYIKTKGMQPIGPLVQYTDVSDVYDKELSTIAVIQQANGFINEVEPPYLFLPEIKCSDCLFVRFEGHEIQLKYAYDKLNLISFEEDIPLSGHIFTVFTSLDSEILSADIFMEKANKEKGRSFFNGFRK